MHVDYSLYLVTDSTPAILGDRDLVSVVDEAIEGGTLLVASASNGNLLAVPFIDLISGVTVIQYRDKTSDTAQLIRTATRLHETTQRRGVPLLINDRVDVVLAVGAEGVHLGQDDMSIETARRLLGRDAIIGITACSVAEAETAAGKGADYLGIGTIFSTLTKTDTKSIIGVTGLRRILASLSTFENIPTVCIGGINATNAQYVLHQSRPSFPGRKARELSGIAVVSAIVASPKPADAARNLRRLVDDLPLFAVAATSPDEPSEAFPGCQGLGAMLKLFRTLAATKPLAHNMTNTVVQNFAANITLALGASPIMSTNGAEAAALAAIPGAALVINMGTLTPESLQNYILALKAYNAAGRPVLLDPVGAGATSIRREAVRTLMDTGYFTVIKGNEAEIRTVWAQGAGRHVLDPDETKAEEEEVTQRGVDSGGSSMDEATAAKLVRDLAVRERNVVLMTGATDYLSDGVRTIAVSNGHAYLGEITGSGCSLGSVVACFLAVDGMQERQDDAAGHMQENKDNPGTKKATKNTLRAVLAALLVYEIAAERAVAGGRVDGPGSFTPAFVDAIYALREETKKGGVDWLLQTRVREVHLT